MDPYQWAYNIWWDRWFPEVLEECRNGETCIVFLTAYCTELSHYFP